MLNRFTVGALCGIGLAYFLDPDRGKRRRNMARDRLLSVGRHGGARLIRVVRHRAGAIRGLTWLVTEGLQREPEPVDDVTLADRVRSEVARHPAYRKGDIVIDTHGGAVELRGQVEHPEDIRALEDCVARVQGVWEVHNLLHLPDTPAPNKASVRRAA